jgi:hypothetical protein
LPGVLRDRQSAVDAVTLSDGEGYADLLLGVRWVRLSAQAAGRIESIGPGSVIDDLRDGLIIHVREMR